MKKTFFILFFLVVNCSCFSQKRGYLIDSIINNYNYLNNERFEELELEDTSGNLIKTSSFAGKVVYVDFWFTTCPPCIKEIPFTKSLQQYFASDTNITFLSICIENVERKTAWKQMIKEKKMPGVHLFYARNRPQKVNLLRKYKIAFPTYLLLNTEMKVIGYNAPRPSETGWVHWSILKASEGFHLSDSYKDVFNHSKNYTDFIAALKLKRNSQEKYQ